jgi:iron complex transport system permease protein
MRPVVVALGIAAVLLVGLGFGATPTSLADLLIAVREPDSPQALIVRTIRLPRVLLAFTVGGGLALSGAALQALVRNPLADPYLLGLSGGAGIGAVTAIALSASHPWAVPLAAFGGALAAIALVYRLAVVAGRRLDPMVLLLGGVVVGAFAGALMAAVIALAPAPQLRNTLLWLLGGFGAASWQTLTVYVAYAVAPATLLLLQARPLDLLALGEEPAQYLGADIERVKRVVYFAASLLTAASVAVCGIIGFVGLVIPHAMRRLAGPLHGVLLPAAIVGGGTFLVLADMLARTVVRPMELPVGVLTAVVGVPLFVVLLRGQVRQ